MSNSDSTLQNYSLKEDIRAYWSHRAATFDGSAGHRIDDRYEMPQWRRLFLDALEGQHAGNLAGKHILDLACGTGEISRVLLGLGAEVTAIDFSEAMMDRAKHKLSAHENSGAWRGIVSDAEFLQLDDSLFDAAVCRHLVWTLTDPAAAFREWRRVLKPGGLLFIIDGNHVVRGRLHKLRYWLADRIASRSETKRVVDADWHNAIVEKLPYRRGLSLDALESGLHDAGFGDSRALSLRRVYGRGMRAASLEDRLRLTSMNRFSIVARK